MSARTQPESKDTRDRLISVAAEEFFEKGYDGASLRQICSRAGVTTGALYFFFKNKEDLFRETISPVIGPTLEAMSAIEGDDPAVFLGYPTEPGGKGWDQWQLLSGLLDRFYEIRNIVKIVMDCQSTPVVQEFVERLTSTSCGIICDYLEGQGIPLDDRSRRSVRALALALITAVGDVLREDENLEDARMHTLAMANFIRGGIAAIVECKDDFGGDRAA